MMKIEENKRQCKKCLATKNRIVAGKYPDDKNIRWVDEFGKQWNGKLCPDCNVERAKETMKKIRKGDNA